jgi:hypothetical protein
MSFVSDGGKFKLYTVLNDLIFPTPTQPRILFERTIGAYNVIVTVCLTMRRIDLKKHAPQIIENRRRAEV